MKVPASIKALKLVAQGKSFATAKQLVQDRRLAKSLAVEGLDKHLFEVAAKKADWQAFKPKTVNQWVLKNDALYFLNNPGKLEEMKAQHAMERARAYAPKASAKAVRFVASHEVFKGKTPAKVRFDAIPGRSELLKKANKPKGANLSVQGLVTILAL